MAVEIRAATYAALRTALAAGAYQEDQPVFVEGRAAAGDGGQGMGQVVAIGSLTDDDGVTLTGGSFAWKREDTGFVDPIWYGADPSGVASSSAAFQSAVDSGFVEVRPRTGIYLFDEKVLVPSAVAIVGVNTGIDDDGARGVTFYADDLLEDFIMENAGITEAPSDPFWHMGRIENIQFRANAALKTASGLNVGPFGDMAGVKNCRFYGFAVGLKVGGTASLTDIQVSANLETLSFYQCTKGLHFQSANYTASIRNLMLDNCALPVHFEDCKQPFHINIDQWHAENMPDADELFLIDNCAGSYVEVRAGSLDGTGSDSALAIVRVIRDDAVVKAKVKVASAYSTVGTHYILKDDDQSVQWTQAELTHGYSEILHNIPEVSPSGLGTMVHGKNFIRLAKRDGGETIYRVESTDSNFSHSFYQHSSAAYAGVKIQDGLTPYAVYAQFRGASALSYLNLFASSDAPYDGAESNGAFLRLVSTNARMGTADSGTTSLWTNNTERCAVDASGHFRPHADGTYTLGTSSLKWSEVFATNGTINTSDEREKRDIAPIDDRVLRAWSRVQFYQYRWIDSVETKGDAARVHFGVIAQRVKEAFEAEGLDAFSYGVLCYDKWDAAKEKWTDAEYDEAGNVVQPAVLVSEARPAGDRFGVRYEQALALECAYLRSRLGTLGA